ncbi:MAG: S-layer homology domain-containing protein [Oscillospiraceae bacterium]|nr:S-layer homology domain-containing protein [Oscillospiraceae bacterium]
MKRRIALLLLALFLLIGAGTPADPLVSLGYLTETWKAAVVTEAASSARDAFAEAIDLALARYGYGAPETASYDFAGAPCAIALTTGQTVTVTTGASLTPTTASLTLTVATGAVLDLTTGEQVTGDLLPNRRYFAVEDTTATVTAISAASALVDGFYRTDGTVDRPHATFRDVRTTSWFYAAVDYVYTNGLFSGTEHDTFSPDLAMTRGMFVTVLHRLDGKPAPRFTSQFADIKDDTAYYYGASCWAAENGIVNGYDDGAFHPDDEITREQMAALLYRYQNYRSPTPTQTLQPPPSNPDIMITPNPFVPYDPYVSAEPEEETEPAVPLAPEPPVYTAINAFPDAKNISEYATASMEWAVKNHLINGSDGNLVPQGTATRAQVAQIILNLKNSAVS